MDNFYLLVSLSFVQGITSSLHCVGMCGPILASIQQKDRKWVDNIIYQGGRLAGYSLLGMILGISGRGIDYIGETREIQWFSGIVASLTILYTGLRLLFPGLPGFQFEKLSTSLRPLYNYFRISPPSFTPFGFGTLSALLPCGVLIPAYTLAFSSGSTPGGVLVMVSFFMGTLPALFLAGEGIRYTRKYLNPKKLSYLGIVLVFLGIGTVLYRVTLNKDSSCHSPGKNFVK